MSRLVPKSESGRALEARLLYPGEPLAQAADEPGTFETLLAFYARDGYITAVALPTPERLRREPGLSLSWSKGWPLSRFVLEQLLDWAWREVAFKPPRRKRLSPLAHRQARRVSA